MNNRTGYFILYCLKSPVSLYSFLFPLAILHAEISFPCG